MGQRKSGKAGLLKGRMKAMASIRNPAAVTMMMEMTVVYESRWNIMADREVN
jgi:hypothetical protein